MPAHPPKDQTFPATWHGAMTRYVFRRHTLDTHAGRAGPRFEIRAVAPPEEEEPAEGYALWRRTRQRAPREAIDSPRADARSRGVTTG